MTKLIDMLIDLGYMIESRRLNQVSLSAEDRKKTMEICREAAMLGLSHSFISRCIEEGAARARELKGAL